MSGLTMTSALVGCIGSAPVFDPATLSLTGWWRAPFSGSNPAGVASAGSSGSNNLTNGANPPTATGTVNGLTMLAFDGTNDELSGAAFSSYWATSAWSGWVLLSIDAINTNDTGNYALNDCILGTSGTAEISVYLRSVGPVVGVTIGTGVGAEASISTGAFALVQFRGSTASTVKEIRVNGGTWQTQAGGTITSLAAALSIGDLAGGFFDGNMVDIGLTNSRLSDTTFDDIKSYINSRYALSL